MTFGKDKRSIAAQRSIDRHINPRHSRANHRLMCPAAEAVEQYTCEVYAWIVAAKAKCCRRSGSPDGFDIHDEEHGSIQNLCDGGGRTDTAPATVVQPHHALDHGDICAAALTGKDLREPCLGHKPCIQIMPRTPACDAVIAEVDVVGADLKGLYGKASRPQCCKQSCRQRCLSCPRLRCRDHNARNIPLHDILLRDGCCRSYTSAH